MFDGIKLLCIKSGDRPWDICCRSVIVREGLYLKIANKPFKCPACGHQSDKLKSFFLQILKLNKAANSFKNSGFYIRNYSLGLQSCHEEGFDVTPYILESDDWINWNMQISSYTLAKNGEPSVRFPIWEDHFLKARPFVHPNRQWELTFNGALKRKALYFMGYEISNFYLLKDLIRETRRYNQSWSALLDNWMIAAPVDLKNPIYLSLKKVDNLAEVYNDTYE